MSKNEHTLNKCKIKSLSKEIESLNKEIKDITNKESYIKFKIDKIQ